MGALAVDFAYGSKRSIQTSAQASIVQQGTGFEAGTWRGNLTSRVS